MNRSVIKPESCALGCTWALTDDCFFFLLLPCVSTQLDWIVASWVVKYAAGLYNQCVFFSTALCLHQITSATERFFYLWDCFHSNHLEVGNRVLHMWADTCVPPHLASPPPNPDALPQGRRKSLKKRKETYSLWIMCWVSVSLPVSVWPSISFICDTEKVSDSKLCCRGVRGIVITRILLLQHCDNLKIKTEAIFNKTQEGIYKRRARTKTGSVKVVLETFKISYPTMTLNPVRQND